MFTRILPCPKMQIFKQGFFSCHTKHPFTCLCETELTLMLIYNSRIAQTDGMSRQIVQLPSVPQKQFNIFLGEVHTEHVLQLMREARQCTKTNTISSFQ